MKKHRRLGFIFVLGLFSFTATKAQAPAKVDAKISFQSTFNQLLTRHKIPGDQVSVTISKLDKEDEWSDFLKFNSDRQRTPASLTKVLTAVAALETIPGDHKFVTELRAGSAPKGDVLEGPLYLVGSGDPTFVTEKMWLLVHEFSRLGVKKINGDLIFDTSVLDDVKFDKTRSTNNQRAYSSPTSGLTFNWNSLWVRIFPNQVGQPARVYLDPPDETIVVRNGSKTANRNTTLMVDRVTSGDVDHIIVGGLIKPGDEFSVYRSHTLPARRAAIQAMAFLKQNGIEVTGEIKEGKAPSSAVTLAKSESVVVDEVVKMMMKFSNNLISEMLVKYIDHQENKRSGTLEGGLEVLRKVLKKYSQKPFTVVNPSGLTTDNKLSTDFLVELMIAMKNHPEHDAEFMASFPRSGIDGTIKRRMTQAKGKIRAKTGLLNGVVGLGGFIHSNEGNLYAFTFIYNGPPKMGGRATDLFDLLAERVALQY